MDDMYGGVTVNSEIDSLPDPKDQVAWLKLELCRLLEERRSAVLRADELETALMEMVKEDNRRQMSAKEPLGSDEDIPALQIRSLLQLRFESYSDSRTFMTSNPCPGRIRSRI